ncbi:Cadherin-Related Family Member 1 [Manis pentadactyla]|nr:Cadherin-Related Family Member 1 [Manis pentadactyla]
MANVVPQPRLEVTAQAEAGTPSSEAEGPAAAHLREKEGPAAVAARQVTGAASPEMVKGPDAQEPSVTGILQPLHSPVSAQRRQPRLRHKDGDPGLRGALPGKRRRNPSAGA